MAIDSGEPALGGLDGTAGTSASTVAGLSALWRRLLQLDDVPLDRDFLELGGQSITVMELIEQTYRVWGVDLQVMDVLNHGSIRRLAELIDKQLAVRDAEDAVRQPRSL
jgi:aryl carrier-like protein